METLAALSRPVLEQTFWTVSAGGYHEISGQDAQRRGEVETVIAHGQE
jgi:hypothetical protein